MLKKTVFLGTAAVLLLGLVFGRSHIMTAWGMAKESIDENVPIEYRLRQAKTMIKGLDPEIERSMRLVAKQEFEVERLTQRLKKDETKIVKLGNDIQRLKNDLEAGGSTYVYLNKRYSEDQVRNDLRVRFERYKTLQSTAKKDSEILQARVKGLEAARQKVKEMRIAKDQLEAEVANLEARLEYVQVAQTANNIKIDNSQLSEVRELVENVTARIAVAEKVSSSDTTYVGEIELDGPESQDILEEITAHFGEEEYTEAIALD